MSSSTMSSSLNFKDRLHSSFPPDKESSWPYPKDEDGMILSNNSIRGELSCLKQAVHAMERRGTYCEWEIAAIQRMWNSHFIHMEAVRHKEEDKFKPILNRRFRLPESVSTGGQVQNALSLMCECYSQPPFGALMDLESS